MFDHNEIAEDVSVYTQLASNFCETHKNEIINNVSEWGSADV